MRKPDNVLKEEVLSLNKCKPHYFIKEVWQEVKNINTQISKLCVDIFLKFEDVTWIAFAIKQELDFITEFSDNNQIWETSCWVKDMMEFYRSSAENLDLYETAHNLNELYKILVIELEFPE